MDHEHYERVLVDIAQTLITEYAVSDVLHNLCDEITTLLPVDGAGVMLAGKDGGLRFAVASDAAVASIETLQAELDDGPSLRAFRDGEQVLVNDLASDEGTYAFASRVLSLGLKSVHAFPMAVHERLVGALNLYGTDAVELDSEEREAAQTLAACATAYVLNARGLDEAVLLADQLQRALDSRVLIEQAKGKLAEQLGTDPDGAFLVLRRHCRNNGVRLDDVSQAVVSGTLLLNYGPQSTEPDEDD